MNPEQQIYILTAELLPNLVATQERRVADDEVSFGPLRLGSGAVVVKGEQGVLVLDGVQRGEDRLAPAEAVGVEPLQVADPDRGLGELLGIGVDLDALDLGRGDLGEAEREGRGGGSPGHHLLFEREQFAERDVEEVATAAGGVEDGDGSQLGEEVVDVTEHGVAAAGGGAGWF